MGTAKTKKESIPRNGTVRSSHRSKERVFIELPSTLLKRADETARTLETNRRGLIRNALERLLDEMEAKEFEQDLAKAYTANAEMNRSLVAEFSEVDHLMG